ncbi:transporter substrate-binding domain-containing protein [Vibrio sp. Of7-15]|uniref:substrate-binding periplasmic protein n=1 Tax=Vibrio sp. Of7-15 TaxID=2724879 RepID=UPI001EF2FBEA|nr:transporter substrate-binding domain-containing protein [Vibrio sp. Of7-15]MCG7495438.1 transporter substrate-binding domain-containing protein [Vibrio sp. Of7-15]
MKKIIFCFLIYFSSSSVVLAAQEVKVSTSDVLPPFVFRDVQGQLTGVYIEIVKKAISRMPDYTVSFNTAPWARVKREAESGVAFAILPPYFHAHDWLTKSEPKRPYIWPYSLPLFTQHDVVICNEKVLIRPRSVYPDDYQGLRFVMWRGDGRAGEKFARMAKEKKINLHLFNSIKGTIPFLLSGRADCTVTSRIPFAWYLKKMKESGEYDEYNQSEITLKEIAVISSNEGYLGYTDINAEKNFPFKKDFSIKFDIEIYKMKKSGEIQNIVNRFIRY